MYMICLTRTEYVLTKCQPRRVNFKYELIHEKVRKNFIELISWTNLYFLYILT